MPTPIQTLPTPKKSASKDTSYVYKLSKDQCKDALKKWVDKSICKSSLAIKDGHIGDVWTYNALDVRKKINFCIQNYTKIVHKYF